MFAASLRPSSANCSPRLRLSYLQSRIHLRVVGGHTEAALPEDVLHVEFMPCSVAERWFAGTVDGERRRRVTSPAGDDAGAVPAYRHPCRTTPAIPA
jgi:hypothetical protein